jgi:hypothetical protein
MRLTGRIAPANKTAGRHNIGRASATVDEARRIFDAEVIEPALAAAPGIGQLVAICDGFFDHLERRTLPGGCLFAGAALEMARARDR